MNNTEIWKDIHNYNGNYQISSLGRIKSIKRVNCAYDKILKPGLDSCGYLFVNLSKNGECVIQRIHKIVAITFHNHVPCKFKEVINHINGDKKDNRVINIEITTNRDNTAKGYLSKNTSSKYTGVCWNKKVKKWVSMIRINGILINLGSFELEYDAHLMYQKALLNINLFDGNKKDFRKLIIQE